MDNRGGGEINAQKAKNSDDMSKNPTIYFVLDLVLTPVTTHGFGKIWKDLERLNTL